MKVFQHLIATHLIPADALMPQSLQLTQTPQRTLLSSILCRLPGPIVFDVIFSRRNSLARLDHRGRIIVPGPVSWNICGLKSGESGRTNHLRAG